MMRTWRSALRLITRLRFAARRIEPWRRLASLGLMRGDLFLLGQGQLDLVQALEQGFAADAVDLELDLAARWRRHRAFVQVDGEPGLAVGAGPRRAFELIGDRQHVLARQLDRQHAV